MSDSHLNRGFAPAWFLRSAHAQTVWGRLTRPRRLVAFRREVLPTPDGDELLLDHLDVPSTAAQPMHVILLHGLEGSSYSVYIQGVLSVLARHGYSATALNFRSCAREPDNILRSIPNKRPRFYHSGETTDFDFVLRTLAARMPGIPIAAFGASLGANVLLKWLGEYPGQTLLSAAAAVSAPYDLGAGSRYLEQGIGRFYVGQFLVTLRKKVRDVVQRFPEVAALLDVDRAMKAKTFRQFDDVATAPLHGFADADDYYARSSSIHFIDRITSPTLCLSAQDDPFLPAEVLPRAHALASASVDFRTTERGGHVGFVAGAMPWRCEYWAEEMLVQWLVEQVRAGVRAEALRD